MIGKPEWFTTRRFGWGLGIKGWEGVVYIALSAGALVGIQYLPLPQDLILPLTGAALAILLADILHIMAQVYSSLDEREQRHQMVAETNASFAGVFALVAVLLYLEYFAPSELTRAEAGIPIIGVLLVMAIAKGATLLYVQRKG